MVCDGGVGTPPMVLAAYIGDIAPVNAQTHANTIAGASVIVLEAQERLTAAVRDDVASEFDEIDTPLDPIESFDVKTSTSTPNEATADRSKRRPR